MNHIEIKKINANELKSFKSLINLFETVFEMQDFVLPDEKHLQHVLSKENFLVFVALSDQKVIGGLTAYILDQYYNEKPLAYLYDLAVDTSFQRQGIGRKLILALTHHCKENNMEEVFVQADETDLHAIDFYQSTGATAEKVVHFNYRCL